jgi:hypothetical protein
MGIEMFSFSLKFTVAGSNSFICDCDFQCGTDAPISAAQMLGEVSRL